MLIGTDRNGRAGNGARLPQTDDRIDVKPSRTTTRTRPYTARALARGVRGLLDPHRPLLAQVVVTRRCNLSCGYCNEYDKFSAPVDTDELLRRIDHLADLGTTVVTLTGGEPLLHPQLDRLVGHTVSRHMFCTSITNGFLLSREWIERLNRAGLYLLQVSVDNLEPNESSQKSLNLLKKRLPLLKSHARFKVNINAVLGSSPVRETRELVRQVRELGFYMTVGLLHSSDGMLDRGLLKHADLQTLYREINADRRRTVTHHLGEGWEREMIQTGASDWKCRAGARYLYIDEDGIVSYCSQRRGEPGIPLLAYGVKHIRHFFRERKGCESACTIACVRRASAIDRLRHQEQTTRPKMAPIPAPVTPGWLAPTTAP
ncbi:MAG: radical SAM protein [Candidatus Zixiibacteriota bacterium]